MLHLGPKTKLSALLQQPEEPAPCLPLYRYLYAVIGMAAFSRFEISSDTPSSDYFQYNCGLGFRNFRCSLYIMFQLLTTSNWHDILNSVSPYEYLCVVE